MQPPRRRSRRREQSPPPWSGAVVAVLIVAVVVAGAVRVMTHDAPIADPLTGATSPTMETSPSLPTTIVLEPSNASPSPAATASPEPSRTRGPTTPLPNMPTPIAVTVSSRYSPIPFTPDAELAARVLERLASVSGRRGIAIKDLDTGRGVLIDPDGEYEAASLFKLEVMYEVFKQRELGVVNFDETLVLTARHVSYDLGTLDRGEGATMGLGEAVERMITISDNSAAILLTDRVGAANISQDLRGIGMTHTRLILDDLVTSPGDMLLFLEMLARGQAVSPSASADMIQLMTQQRVRDRIPRLLPAEATVANKTGNLPGVVNDVAIVYGRDTAFVIAVLVQDTRDEDAAARMTAEIAATAYEYFSSVHGDTQTTHLPTPAPTRTPRPTSPPTAIPASSSTPLATATEVEIPTPTGTPQPPTAVAVTPVQAATAEPPSVTAVPSPLVTTAPPVSTTSIPTTIAASATAITPTATVAATASPLAVTPTRALSPVAATPS
ncbi:MAG: per1 [Chloroflexi bacterium]|nr:per1 [Chloroflexota bacterium]